MSRQGVFPREQSVLTVSAKFHRLTATLSLRHDLVVCRSHSAWLALGQGFIENLERLTFAVSLGRDLGVCRLAQRLARSSPQSSALTKLRHGPLTCGNAWLL